MIVLLTTCYTNQHREYIINAIDSINISKLDDIVNFTGETHNSILKCHKLLVYILDGYCISYCSSCYSDTLTLHNCN